MPRTEDAAAESDSSNATLYCSKDCQVHTAHRKRGGLAIKAVIDYSKAHTNTNVTE